ncbi:N-acetylmuramoyl-L-alanine amidase family protein [Clostridium polynesiense]|uniref:N-acetylmuramoyl-L-alanine amidase family protein n=1 Tax=Clostridium polynesiense TaxID=1325933 RepID=UPI0006946FEC|nr:N-acetylmuramoyl-L-alanine amidase [Clostridium polynesiense]
MVKLVIDAGHGGKDSGAVGATGLNEKVPNLKIALRCGEILSSQGISVEYTRTEDKYITLTERANIANNYNADYFISIHNNSFSDSSASGTETYAYKSGGEGETMARAILNSVVSAIGTKNRGVKYANFAVLRQTLMPATLVEICFISNPDEEARLKDDGFIETVSLAIAKGFLSFIGQDYQEPAPQEPETPDSQEPQAPEPGNRQELLKNYQEALEAFRRLQEKLNQLGELLK